MYQLGSSCQKKRSAAWKPESLQTLQCLQRILSKWSPAKLVRSRSWKPGLTGNAFAEPKVSFGSWPCEKAPDERCVVRLAS